MTSDVWVSIFYNFENFWMRAVIVFFSKNNTTGIFYEKENEQGLH